MASTTWSCLAFALLISTACAADADVESQARTSINLSNLEFNSETALLAVLIAAVLIADIFFGSLLGNLLFGARRRDGLPQDAFARRAEQVYNSLDVAESTFNAVRFSSDVCKHKAVCEWEEVARRRPFAKIVTGLFSMTSGAERYAEAKRYGAQGYDCQLIYAQCPKSMFPSWRLF